MPCTATCRRRQRRNLTVPISCKPAWSRSNASMTRSSPPCGRRNRNSPLPTSGSKSVLTDAGRLWAAAAARLVVWRRTINLQEAEASVTVSIVYLPVGGGSTQGEEAWRVELSGDFSQPLTVGDTSNLALLLAAAAKEVATTRQSPASDRDHRWMRRMRGQEPPDIGPLAEEATWLLGMAGSVAGRGAGRLPRLQMDRGSGSSDAVRERALNDDARQDGVVEGPASGAIATRVPPPVGRANPAADQSFGVEDPVDSARCRCQLGGVLGNAGGGSGPRSPGVVDSRRSARQAQSQLTAASMDWTPGHRPIRRRSAHLNCDYRISVATAATTSEPPKNHGNQENKLSIRLPGRAAACGEAS
jgi:hypothetical protein